MLRRQRITACLVVLATLVLTPSLSAEELTVRLANVNRAPYMGEELPEGGFLSHLVTEAFGRVGYRVEYHYRPWKRAIEEAKNGDLDGVVGPYYLDERAAIFAYPDPLWTIRVHFLTTHSPPMAYRTLADLTPYVVCVLQGTVFEQQLIKAGVRVESVAEVKSNVRKLLAKRIDLTVIPPEVFFFNARQVLTDTELAQVHVLEQAYQENPSYVVFSKQVPHHQQLVADFNRGLREIHADGTYASILNEHGIQAPE